MAKALFQFVSGIVVIAIAVISYYFFGLFNTTMVAIGVFIIFGMFTISEQISKLHYSVVAIEKKIGNSSKLNEQQD